MGLRERKQNPFYINKMIERSMSGSEALYVNVHSLWSTLLELAMIEKHE